MKKWIKWLAGIVLAFILLAVGSYCVLRFAFSIDVLDRSGWSEHNGAVRFLDYHGNPKLKWQCVDGELYYFDPDSGDMFTGWKQIDGFHYYFEPNGIRAVGWKVVGGETYYLGKDGKRVTGWMYIENRRYYFSDTGTMETGWLTLDGKQYYLTDEGYALSGWAEIDGMRYLFADDGSLMTGWFEDATGRYFLGENGVPHVGWLDLEEDRYYFAENGTMLTGWLDWDDGRYYLQPDGSMAVGEIKIDGVSHFFTSAGKYVLLTNYRNPVPEDYVPDLVDIEGFQIDSSCRDALAQMMAACRGAGFYCEINNTYRSESLQQHMWNNSVKRYMAGGMSYEEAYAETGKDTAKPGHSEHQMGLAVDLLGTDAMYAWLAEHCWDYGFILRYPADGVSYTGIIYEPWHFRYVGTELSLELEALGLCMEEYMQMLTQENR